MSNPEGELPTLGQAISNWLGFQLPSIPLPQTLKNIDKAIGIVVLAGGENLEAKIKARTEKAMAQGKIDVEGMYRTQEEKRKLENRASTTKAAIEELQENPATEDAKTEIDNDWLNTFTRIVEDKSSEELQGLFGRILAGEIKRPGSFSLRMLQTMAALSKSEAEAIAKFLSHVVGDKIVAFAGAEPEVDLRLRMSMEELGIAGHPSEIGGIQINYTVQPSAGAALIGTVKAVVVHNASQKTITFNVPGQAVTKLGLELRSIATLQVTPMPYLKAISKLVYSQLKGSHQQEIESTQIAVGVGQVLEQGSGSSRIRWEYNPATEKT